MRQEGVNYIIYAENNSLTKIIRSVISTPLSDAVGCLKIDEPVVTDWTSKYFVPQELYSGYSFRYCMQIGFVMIPKLYIITYE